MTARRNFIGSGNGIADRQLLEIHLRRCIAPNPFTGAVALHACAVGEALA
ncbi:hypothetical protein [Pseudomonas brassicacearum]|nr:hypothetical protein [Pseudomonas brassicacearum]CAH0200976.1 hypothetical protein SRABI06_01913 [Pseudomonas brassicacearum]